MLLLGITQGAVVAFAGSTPEGGPRLPSDAPPAVAPEGDEAGGESWAIHGQATSIWQAQTAFHSAIPNGTNSLKNGSNVAETLPLTLFGGVRLREGAEIWIEPEVDQAPVCPAPTASPAFPTARRSRSKTGPRICACRRFFFARPSISVARARRWNPTWTCAAARRRPTVSLGRSARSRSRTCSTSTARVAARRNFPPKSLDRALRPGPLAGAALRTWVVWPGGVNSVAPHRAPAGQLTDNFR